MQSVQLGTKRNRSEQLQAGPVGQWWHGIHVRYLANWLWMNSNEAGLWFKSESLSNSVSLGINWKSFSASLALSCFGEVAPTN